MSRNDPQLNFRIKEDILARLRHQSAESGLTLADTLNRILDASVPAIPNTIVQVKVRLPAELHSKVQTAAKRNGVSANSEIVRRLESTFL